MKHPEVKRSAAASVLLIVLLIFATCSRRPGSVLPSGKFARLVVDLELADAYVTDRRLSTFRSDSSRLEMRRAVLAKHGVNEAALDSTLHWYGKNLPEYLEVLDRADSILADSLRAIELEERNALAAAAGDSTDLWPLNPSVVFACNQPSDFVTFEVPIDTTWRRGDVVTLSLALHNSVSRLDATIAADYANRGQTTDGITASAYPGDETKLQIKLQLDSTMTARRLYGFLHLSPQPGERAFADSIRLVRTRMVPDDYNHLRRTQRRLIRHEF